MAARVRELPMAVPCSAKLSAVLGLLFPKNDTLNLVLIKRTEDGRAHSGQISFPGGRKEPEDTSLKMTALRETFEEIGVASTDIEVLGQLSNLYIPVSNSNVHPFIGFTPHKPEYILSNEEVQYTMEVPVQELFLPDKKIVTQIRPSSHPELTIEAPGYQWDNDHLIWGATAMIISELEDLLQL